MKEQKKRGRPFNKERQLNKEIIVYMAKTLMREQGKIPSIRGLARTLDVDAMAIYHYFENKNSLLQAILTSLMDNLYFPKKQQYWQDELRLLSESYLNLLKHYSGLLDTLILMPADGPKAVFIEAFNKLTAELNLTPEKRQSALLLLLNFLHGQVLLLRSEPDDETSLQKFQQTFELYCTVFES